MLDYLVFFGLLALGIVVFVLIMRNKKNVVEIENEPPFFRELRKCESPIERKLLRALWNRNHNVVCQYPFGWYRLDMAIPGLKIDIECDGKAYHSTPAQRAHDKKRNAYLRSKGWKVLRFSGSQIKRDVGTVVKRIEQEIQRKYTH